MLILFFGLVLVHVNQHLVRHSKGYQTIITETHRLLPPVNSETHNIRSQLELVIILYTFQSSFSVTLWFVSSLINSFLFLSISLFLFFIKSVLQPI